MDKIWYVKINGRIEGPFSVEDLKKDPRITPDTLARKSNYAPWILMRFIPELKLVFADAPSKKKEKKSTKLPTLVTPDDQLVLSMSKEPYFFWVIVLLVALTCMFFHFYSKL